MDNNKNFYMFAHLIFTSVCFKYIFCGEHQKDNFVGNDNAVKIDVLSTTPQSVFQ